MLSFVLRFYGMRVTVMCICLMPNSACVLNDFGRVFVNIRVHLTVFFPTRSLRHAVLPNTLSSVAGNSPPFNEGSSYFMCSNVL